MWFSFSFMTHWGSTVFFKWQYLLRFTLLTSLYESLNAVVSWKTYVIYLGPIILKHLLPRDLFNKHTISHMSAHKDDPSRLSHTHRPCGNTWSPLCVPPSPAEPALPARWRAVWSAVRARSRRCTASAWCPAGKSPSFHRRRRCSRWWHSSGHVHWLWQISCLWKQSYTFYHAFTLTELMMLVFFCLSCRNYCFKK